MYAETEAEGKRRRYQVDTVSLALLPFSYESRAHSAPSALQIVEGIGLNRITRNLSKALPIIDNAFR